MQTYLKHYSAKITAKAPVFIGSGSKIGKKEFIYSARDNMAAVPDMAKFFAFLKEQNKEDEYEKYMLYTGNKDLGRWLNGQGIRKADYKQFISYFLDAGDALIDTGAGSYASGGTSEAKAKEILCFIKDAEGKPYVPGSSIKGMIRTALLAYEISRSASLREKYKREIEYSTGNALRGGKPNRKHFLESETERLEQEVFHTLQRKDIKKDNAVCSNLSGLVVSDSRPLETETLVLCQKIDYSTSYTENRLPILREALKPGSEIFFDITIDPDVFPYDIEEVLKALEEYQQALYKNFYLKFGRGSNEEGTVWLGGGCGFPSKTVIAALCGAHSAYITSDIFKASLPDYIYKEHGHDRDASGYRISPHVCKCTRYQGKLYDMGQGKIEIM